MHFRLGILRFLYTTIMYSTYIPGLLISIIKPVVQRTLTNRVQYGLLSIYFFMLFPLFGAGLQYEDRMAKDQDPLDSNDPSHTFAIAQIIEANPRSWGWWWVEVSWLSCVLCVCVYVCVFCRPGLLSLT